MGADKHAVIEDFRFHFVLNGVRRDGFDYAFQSAVNGVVIGGYLYQRPLVGWMKAISRGDRRVSISR